MDWSDILKGAAAFFLVLTGLALSYMLIRLAGTFSRVSETLDQVTDQVVPMLAKVNTSLEQVNVQLEKVDRMTTSAADAVDAADRSVRAVVGAGSPPVARVAGLAASVENAFGSFRPRGRRRVPPPPDEPVPPAGPPPA